VSVIRPREDGRSLRVVFNRDELLTRSPARPPVVRVVGGMRAIFPVDGESGGTWIAANDAGIVFALLNVNCGTAQGRISRGTIIPRLLGCSSVAEAADAMRRLPLHEYSPFRLLLLSDQSLREMVYDGQERRDTTHQIDRPFMRTSSGLGDELVERPRRELFDQIVGSAPSARAQDEFHCHAWTDTPHLSVQMSRPDARTVSRTTITFSDRGGAALEYEAL
jgi:uncharacterized protein with NRDE domain